jgi:RNA recognition motif-containing protein
VRAPVFKGNVIVSNLPGQFSSSDLAELFDSYGLVLGAKIERWHDRPGGAQGMVDLAPATSVAKAIEELNGQTLAGNKIAVRPAPVRQKPARPAARPASAPRPAAMASNRLAPNPANDSAPRMSAPLSMSRPAAPTRQVVVEYRAPSRRVTIPPRVRSADHS